MSLYREIGLMRLDPRGVWIDDVATLPDAGPESGQPSDDERPQTPPPDELPSRASPSPPAATAPAVAGRGRVACCRAACAGPGLLRRLGLRVVQGQGGAGPT